MKKLAASTIQKIKIIQAFDDVLGKYECECVYRKDLNRILNQVAEIVTSSTTDDRLSPRQRLYSRYTIQENVRSNKNQAITKLLMLRGSL